MILKKQLKLTINLQIDIEKKFFFHLLTIKRLYKIFF